MDRVEVRSRAMSLILELSATQEQFGATERQGADQNTHRLSLDSKLAQVSRQELLSFVDDKLLIQEVKARLISSEIEDKRKTKRRGSVKDLVKAFDHVQLDTGPALNNGERNSLRFLLGQFTFSELCDESRKRLEADVEISHPPEAHASLDRRLSHGIRRILFHKDSRSLSKGSFEKLSEKSLVIIPEIALPECEEGYYDNSSESFQTCKTGEPLSDTHTLTLRRVEDKPSFEPDLQKTTSDIFESSEEDEDETLMNALDEIFTLKQALWNAANDMEELSEKTTKLRGDLAKLRQMRTAYIKDESVLAN